MFGIVENLRTRGDAFKRRFAIAILNIFFLHVILVDCLWARDAETEVMRARKSIARHVSCTANGDGIHASGSHWHIGGKRYGIPDTAHRAGEHRIYRLAHGIHRFSDSHAD